MQGAPARLIEVCIAAQPMPECGLPLTRADDSLLTFTALQWFSQVGPT
jgi:hypothetical protein